MIETKWDMANADPVMPLDTWFLYQAWSYLGSRCSMEEAKELWEKVDITTRQLKASE